MRSSPLAQDTESTIISEIVIDAGVNPVFIEILSELDELVLEILRIPKVTAIKPDRLSERVRFTRALGSRRLAIA